MNIFQLQGTNKYKKHVEHRSFLSSSCVKKNTNTFFELNLEEMSKNEKKK